MEPGVYKITNLVKRKIYVGEGMNTTEKEMSS